MSNNKQSSVEHFWEQFEEKGYVSQETEGVNKITIMIDVNDYLALKQQAKAMHKEEIMQAHFAPKYGCFSEQYYNETFGGNNEQQ